MTKELHFVSETCQGEICSICKQPATHKVGEEIPDDDPSMHHPVYKSLSGRHNLTAYVCCKHFAMILGQHVYCDHTDIKAGLAARDRF